jgi:hypothetical protein
MRFHLELRLFLTAILTSEISAFSAATRLSLSEARATVESLLPTMQSFECNVELNDPELGQALERVKEAAIASDKIFDPEAVAGTWRVVHAPHLDFLSNFALTKFPTIEYYLTGDGKMASSVQYRSNIFGEGWLNTAGYYRVEESTGNVRIVFDKTWWNIGLSPRPTPPEEGDFPQLIQSLGEIGFMENLSFFPIEYVDEKLAIFKFFGFAITAANWQV